MSIDKHHPIARQICAFIRAYERQHGYAPTIREVADGCYIANSTAIIYLARLEAWGWVTRDPGKARSLRVGPQAPPDGEP